MTNFFRVVAAMPLVLAWLGGCIGQHEDTCEYWTEQLKKGRKEKEAIDKITEKACDGRLEVFAARFPESLYRRDILTAVKGLGKSPKAEELIKSAFSDKEIGPLAISMAVEWKIAGTREDLDTMIRDPKNAERRKDHLTALVQLAGPEGAVEQLAFAAGEEPTIQGIETNWFAAGQLAKADWSKVDPKRAEAAAARLIRTLYVKDAQGRLAQVYARAALGAIGRPAAEPLMAAFAGKDKDLNEFADVHGIPRWYYMQGRELVELLWDVGDTRASPVLMEALAQPLVIPPDVARLPPEEQDPWKAANGNRFSMTALVVGALANNDVIKTAVHVLQQKDPAPDPSQVEMAGLGLALMGTPESREALWTLYRSNDPQIAALRPRIAELKEKAGKARKEEERKALGTEHDKLIDDLAALAGAKAELVRTLAIALSPAEKEAFRVEVVDSLDAPIKEAGAEPLAGGYFDVVDACGDGVDCYIQRLQAVHGKTGELPAAIGAAEEKLGAEKSRVADKAAPVTAQIEEKNKAINDVVGKIKEIDDAAKADPKVAGARKAEKEALIAQNNQLVADVKTLYEQRNLIVSELDPAKKALLDAKKAMNALEKIPLVLGGMKEAREKAVPAVLQVFHESDPRQFVQLRQWSIICLEHIATAADLGQIDAVLKEESAKPEYGFWVPRIKALRERIAP